VKPYGQRVFYEDEMRSGTRTELKKRWGPSGHRPITRVKIGYQFTYLYAALNPYSGKLIALLLPFMTKECFGIFMNYFAQQVKDEYGDQKVLLIGDGASNHQQDTINEQYITLEILPTACPELNPAERFFEQLRTELSNLVFDNLEQVELHLCQILKKYYENPQLVSDLTLFDYIRNR
jgi:transposase